MKISLNWLRDYIDSSLTAAETEQVLTNCGLEVENYETYESIKGGLKGLVTGEVLTCVQHPNADRLRITTVNVGNETPLQIVCGAPNVAEGQKVVVATVGATLYPTSGEPFKISKSKIRGEVSEGMICAEDEIGLGASHDGIMILPADTAIGLPAADILPLYTDTIFEIGLTANRGDAASHLGVARDLHAVKALPLKSWKKTLPAPSANLAINVDIEDVEACPRYTAICISGVKVGPSPQWLKNYLNTIGIGSINNVVDITNYVLHGIGQPIHAFDYKQVKGNKIIVKTARKGDKFTTLDKTTHELQGFELMICNAEEPMAIAGVFGGLHSGITDQTTDVLIESAYFNPAVIRKAAKAHGLSTDASFRYERGTNPDITVDAAMLTASLILEIAGGHIASDIIDVYPNPIKPAQMSFNLIQFNRLAGQRIPAADIRTILLALEINIEKEEGDTWQLSVPAYRNDVTRQVDIAEEVMRIYGYNKIEIPSSIRSCLSTTDTEKVFQLRSRLGDFLTQSGFNEMIGFSLTSSTLYTESEQNELVRILNPLSNELDVLRQSMLFYGLQTIQYNRNRKQTDLKLYEFGKTYAKTAEGYQEKNHLALWVTGNELAPNWKTTTQPVSYFYLKSFISKLIQKVGAGKVTTTYPQNQRLTDCTCLQIGDEQLAMYGKVNKSIAASYDIQQDVFYADLNWDALTRLGIQFLPQVKPVSKFPEVRRDLSLLLDQSASFFDLERIARDSERKLLREVDVFDVYEGDKLPPGKKSYALSFILVDEEKTLTSEQVDKVMQKLADNYRKQLNAEIRQ